MRERLAGLDLLRGCAALGVAIPHFMIYFGDGGALLEAISSVAVEVFFVLSGFVLAPQLLIVVGGQMRFGLATFLVRRWMRTIPPYAMALCLVSLLFGVMGSAEFWRYLTYTQNLFRQHLANDYYPVAWSLSVEEWFYVVFPAFLLAASFGLRRSIRLLAGAALAFILAITIARQVFGAGAAWGPDVRRVVAFRIDSIAWGFLLYLALERWPRFARAPVAMGAAAAILALALLGVTQRAESGSLAQFLFPLTAAAFGCACICAFAGLQDRLAGGLSRQIAEIAGGLSYPIYLYHLLMIYLLAGAPMAMTLKFGLYIVGTGVLAVGSYYYFEQPILALRPHYRKKDDPPCAEDSYSASASSSSPSPFSSRSPTSRWRHSPIRNSEGKTHPLLLLGGNVAFTALCLLSVEAAYRAYLLAHFPKRFSEHRIERSFTVYDGSSWRYDRDFGYDYFPGRTVALATISDDIVVGCAEQTPVDAKGNPPPSVPDFDSAKFKILVFGDSMTEGALDGQTWVSLLQSKLDKSGDGAVRVRNLARDGYGVLQMFDLAAAKVPEIKPNLAIFAFNSGAVARARTWRTQIGKGADVRLVTTNDSAANPDLAQSSEFAMIAPAATRDWCERMKSSAPDVQARDKTLRDILAKRAYLLEQNPQTPPARRFNLRASYAYDQLAHRDPFFSQPREVKAEVNLFVSDFDYARDEKFRRDVEILKKSGVPLLLVHLPLGGSLAREEEFWLPKPEYSALLNSMEKAVGQNMIPMRPRIHTPPSDAMKLCQTPQNCHPSELGMEVYAQAVFEMIAPYLPDAPRQ